MASNTYASKQWTVERAIGFLRILVNELAPSKIQTLPLVDYINLSLQEFAAMLDPQTKKEDYGTSLLIKDSASGAGQVELVVDSTPFLTAYADISVDASTAKLRIDSITSISYSRLGALTVFHPAIFTSPLEFENLLDFSNRNKEVYWYQFGEKLYFLNRYETIAAATDWGNLKVYYNRFPIKHTVDSADRLGDTLDIRDAFVDSVLAKAKLYIYEELGMTPPEALQGMVQNAIAGIKESLGIERQIIDEKAKKNQS